MQALFHGQVRRTRTCVRVAVINTAIDIDVRADDAGDFGGEDTDDGGDGDGECDDESDGVVDLNVPCPNCSCSWATTEISARTTTSAGSSSRITRVFSLVPRPFVAVLYAPSLSVRPEDGNESAQLAAAKQAPPGTCKRQENGWRLRSKCYLGRSQEGGQ